MERLGLAAEGVTAARRPRPQQVAEVVPMVRRPRSSVS